MFGWRRMRWVCGSGRCGGGWPRLRRTRPRLRRRGSEVSTECPQIATPEEFGSVLDSSVTRFLGTTGSTVLLTQDHVRHRWPRNGSVDQKGVEDPGSGARETWNDGGFVILI